jgi:hypothetical protein
MAATDTYTTEELLEAVFSVRSVPKLYNEGVIFDKRLIEDYTLVIYPWHYLAIT